MFSECPSFFVVFVNNDGALNLHLYVVVLPASVIMSRPAKCTKKVNTSRLDFLVLVFQSSDNFGMKGFFQVFKFCSGFYILLFTKEIFN